MLESSQCETGKMNFKHENNQRKAQTDSFL